MRFSCQKVIQYEILRLRDKIVSANGLSSKSLLVICIFSFLVGCLSDVSALLLSPIFALFCLIMPLFRIPKLLPSAIFILVVSNFFDPMVGRIVSPFHSGLLAVINPTQFFCIGATFSVFLVCGNYVRNKGRLEFGLFLLGLLVILAFASAVFGIEYSHDRKLQSIFFVLNLGAFYWAYFFGRFLNWTYVKSSYKIFFYMFFSGYIFIALDLLNSHASFILYSCAPWYFFALSHEKKFLLVVFSPLLLYIAVKAIFFLSMTTMVQILFFLLFVAVCYKVPRLLKTVGYSAVLLTSGLHMSMFVLALLGHLPPSVSELVDSGFAAYDPNESIFDRIWFKFILDRFPLWIGAYDAIQENFWFAASGSTFWPANFGTFAAEHRQIEWVAGAHNLFLELLLNFGAIGALLFLFFWIGVMLGLVRALENRSNMVRILSISLMSYFLFPSLIGNFVIQEHSFLAWVMAGALIGISLRKVGVDEHERV